MEKWFINSPLNTHQPRFREPNGASSSNPQQESNEASSSNPQRETESKEPSDSIQGPTSHKINQKWILLQSDPAKRQQIIEYHPNDQDEVRRAYLLKGRTRIDMPTYPASDFSGLSRSFQNSWFDEFDWLEYSVKNDAVFCFPCFLFYNGSNTSRAAFVKDGWNSWNLKKNLKRHIGSKPTSHHNKCVKMCDDLMNQKRSIESSLAQYTEKEKSEYVIRLKASLEAVKYLVRGGLAFRGHDEGENSVYKGHFLEFIEVLGRNCVKIIEAIKNAPGNHKMTALGIQKDLANACAVETVKKIIKEIGDGVFCVLVDESSDISDKEQMGVVLRFVDDKGFVVERLIGIVHVEETSAITLKEALETLLSGFGLCINNIRGQGYDGANNMKGCFGDLRTLIQKENPQAYYVHCFAHQLQLALVSTVRSHDDVRSFFTEVTRIVHLIRSSNKRQALLRSKQAAQFEDLVANDMVQTGKGLNQEISLARASDTRWGSHFRVLVRLKNLFSPIVEVFEELESDRYSTGEAKGLLLMMQQFDFIFMMHLMIDILAVTNDLSQILQKSDQDLLSAIQLVQVNKDRLQQMREDGREEFYKRVVAFCGNLEINVPDMESRYVKANKSQRKAPLVTSLNYFKHDCFFQIIDLILTELNDRFNLENTELLHCVACLSPISSFEAFDNKTLVRMSKLYPNDFLDVEDEELSAQLEAYIHCVRMDVNFSNLNGISDLCRALVRTKKHKTFRFVYKLVKLALTLPVATASVERVFSGMNYVKSELRNKMSNPWLNDCLVTFVEKEVFSTVDDRDILNRFHGMRSRKMQVVLK